MHTCGMYTRVARIFRASLRDVALRGRGLNLLRLALSNGSKIGFSGDSGTFPSRLGDTLRNTLPWREDEAVFIDTVDHRD